jgi:ABC-type spermidine/putrescine transport system permease subunit I
LLLFLIPVARLMLLSVEGGTFAHYERALTDGLYVRVLLGTLQIGLYVSLVCLVLGYPVAHFLATASARWATIGFVFLLLPFWTSLLVRTYAWMVLLGRNGVFNRLLLDLGAIDAPLPLLNNRTGVVIGMVHVLLPYMVLPIFNALRKVDPNLVHAAEGLGAPFHAIFRRIYVPLTIHGVVAGVTLVFVLSLGFFITPALLGGGRVVMIANLIEQQVREFLNWAFAGALSVLLLGATLAAFVLVHRTLRLRIGGAP